MWDTAFTVLMCLWAIIMILNWRGWNYKWVENKLRGKK